MFAGRKVFRIYGFWIKLINKMLVASRKRRVRLFLKVIIIAWPLTQSCYDPSLAIACIVTLMLNLSLNYDVKNDSTHFRSIIELGVFNRDLARFTVYRIGLL